MSFSLFSKSSEVVSPSQLLRLCIVDEMHAFEKCDDVYWWDEWLFTHYKKNAYTLLLKREEDNETIGYEGSMGETLFINKNKTPGGYYTQERLQYILTMTSEEKAMNQFISASEKNVLKSALFIKYLKLLQSLYLENGGDKKRISRFGGYNIDQAFNEYIHAIEHYKEYTIPWFYFHFYYHSGGLFEELRRDEMIDKVNEFIPYSDEKHDFIINLVDRDLKTLIFNPF